MRRARLGLRAAVVASAAAVVAVVAVLVVAFAARGSGGANGFNACISQTRSLVLTRHESGSQLIEMVKDRARGALVGEFARVPSVRAAEVFPATLAGAAARNGRYVMFTEIPVGRDAGAIELCFDRAFPLDDS